MRLHKSFLPLVFALFGPLACAALPAKEASKPGKGANRVASMLVSEKFLNEVFSDHLKSEIVPELKIDFDAKESRIYFRGVAVVPVEEMRAINLEPSMSSFRFQVGVKPDVTEQGHLR